MCRKQTKLFKTILLVMMIALFISDAAWGIVGDVWNAKDDWSDISNPNVRTSPPYGTWSYRLQNGDLMVRAFGDCGGSPGDWSGPTGDCPNLFNDNWFPGGDHGANEFAGHGPWMVQWKSPINGYIMLSGSLWQKFETSRQMAYYLILNGEEIFAYDFIPQDVYGNTILGREGMVIFDSIIRPVNINDTIDFIVDGSGPGGDGTPTFAVAVFSIEQIDKPSEVFVDDGYSSGGDNDGHTWLFDAFKNIQEAMDVVYPGGTVYVAAGTYNESIDFKGKAFSLYGIGGPGVTTIDGTGYYHVVQCVSGEDANSIIEGFTITGGNANGTGSNSYGGGMYCENSSPTVTNCTFSGNQAGEDGGGMFNNNSNPTLTNCLFFNNYAADVGGGMLNSYSDPNITNCTFSGNSAGRVAGGMHTYYSRATVTNCILWGNTPDEISDTNSTPNVTYSDIQGGWSGEGNIDADPCFANPGNDDYHLKSEAGRWDPNSKTWTKDTVSSPCIDGGNPNSDWTREYWPHGERINMGAYGGAAESSASLSKAGNGGDFNNDMGSDYRDMKLIIEKWLYKAMLLPEDVSRDGIVNFADFATFAHYFELSAHHPNPGDGAKAISATADLSWTSGRDATSHDVYFGTSNPPPFIQNQTSAIFDPGTMLFLTTYYWRIDEVSTCGTIKGVVWSFTTFLSPPPP